ncbi:hypothetical protein ABEW59_01005 [Bacillus wiedmannii]|uniref:hypothetical protein n=1 Tax=Bacillus wiedmannii TaxID=1890302 RepID=UPI003D2194D4
MNKSSSIKQKFKAIGQYQLLFWFLILISGIALKNLKEELTIDLNSIFSEDIFHNSGKFLSFFMAWAFIFIYSHFSSLPINNMYSTFLNLISDNIKKLLNPKIILITIITFFIFYLTLKNQGVVSLTSATILLVLHTINAFLLYYISKDISKKFSTRVILLYIFIFFIATVYVYLNNSLEINSIVSLVNFFFLSFSFTFISFLYLSLLLMALYTLYSIMYAEYSAATLGKIILENNLRLRELKSCKIPDSDGSIYTFKDLPDHLIKQIESAHTKSNYISATTAIIPNNIVPNTFKDSLINTFNSIRISKEELQKEKTSYVHFRNQVNLIISAVTAIITLILVIILPLSSIIGISSMKKFLFIIYIFIFLRLLSRCFEICISFYQDIIAKKSLKNTLLTGTDRISLAIKSILEIIFTVATLSIIEVLYSTDLLNILREQHDFAQLLKLIIFSFSNSIATSLFNISFPGVTHNVTLLTLSHQLIHIMQVITSLTLITLSIANYINLPKYSFYYELRETNTELILYKVFHTNNTKCEKLILSAHSIDSLSSTLHSSWQNGKLTDTDYLEIKEFLSDNKNK